jgi:hypothetical protein
LDGNSDLREQETRDQEVAGREASYNGDVSFGSVQIAGESVAHTDPAALLDAFRREAATVASLLERARMAAPEDDEPDEPAQPPAVASRPRQYVVPIFADL